MGLVVIDYPNEIPDMNHRAGSDGGQNIYSVYDYVNDKLYENIGGYGLGGGYYQKGIINDHQILASFDNDSIFYKLVVQDFKNKTFQDLPIKLNAKNRVEAAVAENGFINIWITGGTDLDGSYTLNTKTLELNKYR